MNQDHLHRYRNFCAVGGGKCHLIWGIIEGAESSTKTDRLLLSENRAVLLMLPLEKSVLPSEVSNSTLDDLGNAFGSEFVQRFRYLKIQFGVNVDRFFLFDGVQVGIILCQRPIRVII